MQLVSENRVLETYEHSFAEQFRSLFSLFTLKRSTSASKINIGKKAAFITSLPFYWLIFFNLIGYFDVKLFSFTIISSIIMSLFGKSWGILDNLVR
ncbi:hypothetical protein ACFL0W_04335 [Nanoarchaeota archaeon]